MSAFKLVNSKYPSSSDAVFNLFVFFPFNNFGLLKTHLNNIKYDLAEIDYLPSTPIVLDSDKEKRILDIVEALEDLDDVQRVFTNLG